MRQDLEHQEQAALFHWASVAESNYPELGLMYAIPNGGNRDPRVGAKLKREGVRSGTPDICLPVARGAHAALYIEMKVRPKKPTIEQIARGERLSKAGNLCAVAYSWEAAKDMIEFYLKDQNFAGTALNFIRAHKDLAVLGIHQ